MMASEALKMVRHWPDDKTVPQRLRQAYDDASGEEKEKIGTLSEALIAAADTPGDIALIAKHWS